MTEFQSMIEKDTQHVIGEHTAVRIGLLICIVGGLCGVIWWAATLTATVQTIATTMQSMLGNHAELKMRMDNVDLRLRVVETAGSPKSLTLERELSDIRRMLELHTAKEQTKASQ